MSTQDTIIVAGCMRSGTTLLDSLACSTDATNPLIHECDFLIELTALYQRNRDAFQQRWLGEYFGTGDRLTDYMGRTIREFFDLVRSRYAPASKLVLKNPELTPFLPTLHQLCPEARFLVSIRDPRDTIASIVEVAARLAKKGQKIYVVGDGRDVTTAANYFNAVYAPVLEARDRNPAFAEALLLVRYEDLCAKPLEVLPAIEQHCGIKLDAYDPGARWSRTLVKDTSEWSTPLWGGKVSSDSVGRFRQVLQADETAIIESICGPFMAQFGYPTT